MPKNSEIIWPILVAAVAAVIIAGAIHIRSERNFDEMEKEFGAEIDKIRAKELTPSASPTPSPDGRG